MNLHDRREAVAAQALRVYLSDGDVVGDMTVEELARRVLHTTDKTVGLPDPLLAWRAYARTHFKLEDSDPTESELLGMRAALGAAFWMDGNQMTVSVPNRR